MRSVLIAFLACEVAYWVAVRLLLGSFGGFVWQRELYWTGIRLVSLGLLAGLFVRFKLAPGMPKAGISARWLIATGIFLVPLAVGDMELSGLTRNVFAVTSLAVGFREELAYRGILQGVLRRRFGFLASLLISNVAFVLYHYGVQPFTLTNILEMGLVGMVLGVAYEFTGSLLWVALLHSVYDAVWVFTPLLPRPLPPITGSLILGVILVALLLAGRKTKISSISED